ncbi:MAG: type II toxin-antitoxin system PemK/MazF family toxin [Mycobacteriales bacterium]
MRGDIYRLKAGKNASGREQHGPRYGIVMQSDAVIRSTVVVVPTSASAIASDTRVPLAFKGIETYAMTEQMAVVDLRRLGDKVGHADHQTMHDIETAIRLLLGMF